MFKIMKGYKNFAFTPSGKSLKKILVHNNDGVFFDKKMIWFLLAYTVNLFIKAYHRFTFKEDLKIT